MSNMLNEILNHQTTLLKIHEFTSKFSGSTYAYTYLLWVLVTTQQSRMLLAGNLFKA